MIKSLRIYIRCCKCLHIGQFRHLSFAPGAPPERHAKASDGDGTWMEYRKSLGNDGVVDNIAYTLYVYIYIMSILFSFVYIYMYTATIPTSVGKWMENDGNIWKCSIPCCSRSPPRAPEAVLPPRG